jgi:hypothetical protein
MAEHILSAEPTHSRWNRALPPRLAIAPGDTVHMECVDASSAQVRPGMSVADYLTIDRGRIHALTETIFVEGAEPGDVLQIEVLKVVDKGWGWTSVIPGLGFLKERFSELGKVRERPGRLLTYPGRSIFMSDWTRSTSDLATCWRGTGPRSRSFILRERLSDCANRAEHEIRLILHDPVGAQVRQHMTASWQTSRDGDVLCASLCWCGHRG